MEQLAQAWASFAEWARALPVPPPGNGELVVVIGTVVLGFGLAGLANGWVERRTSRAGLFATTVGVVLLAWAWQSNPEAGLAMVPEAFIELLADLLR